MRRRVVFLGSPEAAVPVMAAIVDAGHEIVCVVSQPDAKRGRGSSTSPTPVKSWALEHGLDVTDNLESIMQFVGQGVMGVVVAYGRIVPKHILEAIPMVNVHFSLLPRWRGAAPVERAILAGDAATGVCIMDVEETLDTGAVYARKETPITELDTATTLTRRLSEMGARLMVEVLEGDMSTKVPQTGEASYAHKIKRDELLIDWSRTTTEVLAMIRALPAVSLMTGKRVQVIEAEMGESCTGVPGTIAKGELVATGDGALRLLRVQPEGRHVMSAQDWVRGLRNNDGVCFDPIR